MLLAIDIGNSDIVLGLHDGQRWLPLHRIPTHFSPRKEDYEAEFRYLFTEVGRNLIVDRIILSSVVPGETAIVRMAARAVLGNLPLLVGPDVYPKLGLKITSPREIGTDLVANAVYAHYTYRPEACVVVDFGTALTFTVVSGTGKIEGVSIAPGLKTAVRSLSTNTAQLPEVPLVMPNSAIGKNTVHAIQAGILWGYVGLVKEVLSQIQAEVGPCKVLATGGLSSVLTPLHGLFEEVDPLLTLNGLRLISELVA
ncbi:MAG: type III pantothenate kinase [Sphingobacteriaceae bacterium]|nr:type III pantothenate kinase [Cytophagaceae bacterium]